MPAQPLTRRMDRLEQRMDALETLPAQVAHVGTQLSQLREEVAAGFSAMRQEFRGEMAAQGEAIRTELRAEMATQSESLRREIRGGDDETRRYMRVLHEEVIDRLKQIQEGQPRTRRR